jgi:hypothetical protein
MMNTGKPAILTAATPSLERPTGPEDLVHAFLSGLKPTTIRSYAADLRAFAAWLGAPDPATAAQRLLADQADAVAESHHPSDRGQPAVDRVRGEADLEHVGPPPVSEQVGVALVGE